MPDHRTRRALTAGGPAVLLLAALLPDLRPVAAPVLLGGWVALRAARRPEAAHAAVAWAAVLPVGLVLVWPWLLGGDAPLGESGCVAPFAVIVLRRLLIAATGLAAVGALVVLQRSSLEELGLRRPTRWEAAVAVAGAVVLAVGGLWIGPLIARPFFGPLDFPVPPAALLPAVLFGVANGVLEEVGYRGAMQAWLGRVMPVAWAIGLQGLAFGIIHAGPDVVALLPVHIALLGAVGVAGGLVRARTGSLWIPIGVHVGADIALYVGLACRAAA
jgi:membrane protease YdiL (CAAX protease family)